MPLNGNTALNDRYYGKLQGQNKKVPLGKTMFYQYGGDTYTKLAATLIKDPFATTPLQHENKS